MQHRWETYWFCAQVNMNFPTFMWWLKSLETWNSSPKWSYYQWISLKSPNQLTSASFLSFASSLLFWNAEQEWLRGLMEFRYQTYCCSGIRSRPVMQQCERGHRVLMSLVRVQLKHRDLQCSSWTGLRLGADHPLLLKLETSQQPTCPVPELDTYLFLSEHNQGLASILQNYSISLWKIKFLLLLLLQSYWD